MWIDENTFAMLNLITGKWAVCKRGSNGIWQDADEEQSKKAEAMILEKNSMSGITFKEYLDRALWR